MHRIVILFSIEARITHNFNNISYFVPVIEMKNAGVVAREKATSLREN